MYGKDVMESKAPDCNMAIELFEEAIKYSAMNSKIVNIRIYIAGYEEMVKKCFNITADFSGAYILSHGSSFQKNVEILSEAILYTPLREFISRLYQYLCIKKKCPIDVVSFVKNIKLRLSCTLTCEEISLEFFTNLGVHGIIIDTYKHYCSAYFFKDTKLHFSKAYLIEKDELYAKERHEALMFEFEG